MNAKKFKPGDRVQLRSDGRIMEVIKYVNKFSILIGNYVSEDEVECVWYENGVRKSVVFNQKNLTRASKPSGLFMPKALYQQSRV